MTKSFNLGPVTVEAQRSALRIRTTAAARAERFEIRRWIAAADERLMDGIRSNFASRKGVGRSELTSDLRDLTERLRGEGIVQLDPGIISGQEACRLGARILEVVAPIRECSPRLPDGSVTQFSDCLASTGGLSLEQLISCEQTVVDVRGRTLEWDTGMLDVFNPSRSLLPELRELDAHVERLDVPGLLSTIHDGMIFRLSHTNVYVNWGVTDTRRFHVDDYEQRQYKLFVLFTDVPDLTYGPYCYVLRSHSAGVGFASANMGLARIVGSPDAYSTDVFLAECGDAVAAVGPAGTVLLSNQSGAHRGFPQAPDRLRVVGVYNFVRV